MLTTSDSENYLPVFPFLSPASRHDSFGFLYNWFSMKQFLLEADVKKLPLDSAHDAMDYYEYCRGNSITPFIDLNGKAAGLLVAKMISPSTMMASLYAVKGMPCTGTGLNP